MRRLVFAVLAALLAVAQLPPPLALAADSSLPQAQRPPDVSLKLEVEHAIDKALGWLQKRQNPDGSWSQPEYPALTALALTAFMGEPSGRYRAAKPEAVQRGYLFLLKNVQPNGGIYGAAGPMPLENYNTAVSLTALVVSRDKAYEQVIRRARNYLVSLQNSGGIGYNKTGGTDLSNTVLGLEALYYSRYLARDVDPKSFPEGVRDLDWKSAVEFIQSCQNLPEYNKQPWASDDPVNRGGFVYSTNESKAGEMNLESGRTALRSYGSISYAGLLSYVYADLTRDDPRVQAVLDWLQRNYTLEENPGMGQEGLYYYFHTMAKALSAAGVDRFTLKDGRGVDWRRELALKLLSLQDGSEGFWVNTNGRWWEKDPVLTTAYSLIALEIVHRGL